MDLGSLMDAVFDRLKDDGADGLLQKVERELITRVFADSGQNQAKAAKVLGITRTTLKKRLQEYGLVK